VVQEKDQSRNVIVFGLSEMDEDLKERERVHYTGAISGPWNEI
jgi:hypothetical protein